MGRTIPVQLSAVQLSSCSTLEVHQQSKAHPIHNKPAKTSVRKILCLIIIIIITIRMVLINNNNVNNGNNGITYW